jgi:hypothetical protein
MFAPIAGWGRGLRQTGMDLSDQGLDFFPQFWRECHQFPSAGGIVPDETFGNGDMQHFFQAQGLQTELSSLAQTAIFSTAFVFDWAGSIGSELNHIANTPDFLAMFDQP